MSPSKSEHLSGLYKNLDQGIVVLVYRCHPTAGTPTPTDESRHTQWLHPERLHTLMDEAYAIRLLDAYTDRPTSRAHDGHRLI